MFVLFCYSGTRIWGGIGLNALASSEEELNASNVHLETERSALRQPSDTWEGLVLWTLETLVWTSAGARAVTRESSRDSLQIWPRQSSVTRWDCALVHYSIRKTRLSQVSCRLNCSEFTSIIACKLFICLAYKTKWGQKVLWVDVANFIPWLFGLLSNVLNIVTQIRIICR